MRAYFAILKIRMKALFQYRTAALAAICAQIFWGIVVTMILRAFYAEAPTAIPISLTQAIAFVWIGQALLPLLPWTIDRELEAQVKNGNVAYELVRPLHLYGLWFARAIALRLAPTLLRCLPVFILGGWLFGLIAPVSGAAAACFVLSILFSIILSAAITTLVVISLFWTLSGDGIHRLLPHCTLLLSGMTIPLPLFPNWLQPFLSLQPFRGIMDIPCRFYTGVIPVSNAPYFLGFQLAWAALFILCGYWLMHRVTRRLIIQGG